MTHANPLQEKSQREIDPIAESWLDDVRELIHPTKPMFMLEILQIDGKRCFEILSALNHLEGQKETTTKTALYNAVRPAFIDKYALNAFLVHLVKGGYVTDQLTAHRKHGRVLNKHVLKLTDRGRKAIPTAMEALRLLDEAFPPEERRSNSMSSS